MTRTIEVDLDLLKQLQDQIGQGIYLRLFQDGSGRVLISQGDHRWDDDKKRTIRGSSFSPRISPNDGLRRLIKPKPPTLLEDLETVRHSSNNSKIEEAYRRLAERLSR